MRGRIYKRDEQLNLTRCPRGASACVRARRRRDAHSVAGAVALAWCVRDSEAVSTVVFGASKVEQIAANVEALELSLDAPTVKQIDELSKTWPRPHPQLRRGRGAPAPQHPP